MQTHPVRQTVFDQGRTLTWVAGQLDISPNYLHRILLPPGDRDARPTPPWFYERVASLLGVSEDVLRPDGARETVAA